jgi:hypothetical protein
VRGCKGFECELRAGRSDRWNRRVIDAQCWEGVYKVDFRNRTRLSRFVSRFESRLIMERGCYNSFLNSLRISIPSKTMIF